MEIFGVSFKNVSELYKVLKYSHPLSGSVLKKSYGGSFEQLVRVRLGLKQADSKTVHDALQNEKSKYQATQDPNAAGPGLAAIQNAIRLSILNTSDQTLQMAAAAAGVSFTPDQMRAALQIYGRGFDLAAAARILKEN